MEVILHSHGLGSGLTGNNTSSRGNKWSKRGGISLTAFSARSRSFSSRIHSTVKSRHCVGLQADPFSPQRFSRSRTHKVAIRSSGHRAYQCTLVHERVSDEAGCQHQRKLMGNGGEKALNSRLQVFLFSLSLSLSLSLSSRTFSRRDVKKRRDSVKSWIGQL